MTRIWFRRLPNTQRTVEPKTDERSTVRIPGVQIWSFLQAIPKPFPMNRRSVKIGAAVILAPTKTKPPFSSDKTSDELTGVPHLLERWRRLATGLRGVRLFRIAANGDNFVWQAECKLGAEWVVHRFASELHARAWLSVVSQSRMKLSSIEKLEVNRPCSSSCFANGG